MDKCFTIMTRNMSKTSNRDSMFRYFHWPSIPVHHVSDAICDLSIIKMRSQVIFSSRSKLHSALVLVKGSEREWRKVTEATALLINFMCNGKAVSIRFEISAFLLCFHNRPSTAKFCIVSVPHFITNNFDVMKKKKQNCAHENIQFDTFVRCVSFNLNICLCLFSLCSLERNQREFATRDFCASSWHCQRQEQYAIAEHHGAHQNKGLSLTEKSEPAPIYLQNISVATLTLHTQPYSIRWQRIVVMWSVCSGSGSSLFSSSQTFCHSKFFVSSHFDECRALEER